MSDNIALKRYLQHYIEPDLPPAPAHRALWQHALVIPAFRESAEVLHRLAQLQPTSGRALLVLVLNRPDYDNDPLANHTLREAVCGLPTSSEKHAGTHTYTLNNAVDLYLLDLETTQGASPAKAGVGLARKVGNDLVLTWMAAGAVSGDWIHNSDADATLPADYFERTAQTGAGTVAACYPFRHEAGGDNALNQATALYELRLHHYQRGLAYAQSPCAYYTLGSCLAVKAKAYAQVRGFPKRAAAEDFYLLNKLAKLGAIEQLAGRAIRLPCRASDRVPFGTGPAAAAIASEAQPRDSALFYHPASFDALRALLLCIPVLRTAPLNGLHTLLEEQGLNTALAVRSETAMLALGLEATLQHCRRQGRSAQQFTQQFHVWFDAFRTLKFIHALRDSGWPPLSLASLAQSPEDFWPEHCSEKTEPDALLSSIRQTLDWQ